MEINTIKERAFGESDTLYTVNIDGAWIFRSVEKANAFISLVQSGDTPRTAYRKIAWGMSKS